MGGFLSLFGAVEDLTGYNNQDPSAAKEGSAAPAATAAALRFTAMTPRMAASCVSRAIRVVPLQPARMPCSMRAPGDPRGACDLRTTVPTSSTRKGRTRPDRYRRTSERL